MSHNILYCSMCGKNYNDVNKLITDDDVTLCDVCYEFCASVKDDNSKKEEYGLSENTVKQQ
jgi:ATP-dependent protease Clp ATPase subunit